MRVIKTFGIEEHLGASNINAKNELMTKVWSVFGTITKRPAIWQVVRSASPRRNVPVKSLVAFGAPDLPGIESILVLMTPRSASFHGSLHSRVGDRRIYALHKVCIVGGKK